MTRQTASTMAIFAVLRTMYWNAYAFTCVHVVADAMLAI